MKKNLEERLDNTQNYLFVLSLIIFTMFCFYFFHSHTKLRGQEIATKCDVERICQNTYINYHTEKINELEKLASALSALYDHFNLIYIGGTWELNEEKAVKRGKK